MATGDTVGTARDALGALGDIARALKAQHQELKSGALQGPTGPAGPQGPKGDTGATGPSPQWFSGTTWHTPLLVSADAGITISWDAGTSRAGIGLTNLVPPWYQVGGDVYVDRVTSGRGIDFVYDIGTGSLSIQTNFPPPGLVQTVQDGEHRAHELHRLGVARREATTDFVFTESEWKNDANAPIDNPGVGTASINVRVIGRDPNATPAGVFDWTFRGTIFRYYAGGSGNWVVDTSLTQIAAISTGTASTLTVFMALSGTNDGTITVTVVNASSSGVESDFAVTIDIIGSGRYGT